VTAFPRLRTRRRRLLRAGLAVLAAIVVVVVAIEATEPPRGDTEVLGATKKGEGPIIDASCDIDGVHVSYGTDYRSSPGSPQYRVVGAEVREVAPTCAGATVSVRLLDGTTTLATATTTANATSVSLSFSQAPPAEQVSRVAVEIAGGTVPVPSACSSMGFDRFTSLTAGPDTHAGSKDRDLTYGGAGNDTLRGDNQNDCLDGQGGADQLFGDNHDDVLLGGEGNDVLTGGNGDDTIDGGPGTDRCLGGTGKNTLTNCEIFQ